MTTLAEIEKAVERLPLEEQEQLLRHLGTRVRQQRRAADPTSREQWMTRLDGLRASIGTGLEALTTEQILAESREERG